MQTLRRKSHFVDLALHAEIRSKARSPGRLLLESEAKLMLGNQGRPLQEVFLAGYRLYFPLLVAWRVVVRKVVHRGRLGMAEREEGPEPHCTE